jgi:hypothetical protein
MKKLLEFASAMQPASLLLAWPNILSLDRKGAAEHGVLGSSFWGMTVQAIVLYVEALNDDLRAKLAKLDATEFSSQGIDGSDTLVGLLITVGGAGSFRVLREFVLGYFATRQKLRIKCEGIDRIQRLGSHRNY